MFFADKKVKAHQVPQVTFPFMIILSLKFNCAVENIEEMRVDGKMNNDDKLASIKLVYGNSWRKCDIK